MLEGGLRLEPRQALALGELTRTDLIWAVATGLASAALFATVITSHPGLSDAPEAVAGVKSLGILHAPGYFSYVLAAKAFTLLVPVGNEAFRVNLFSLVCASLSVAIVQLLARRFGVSRWAAALGALCLAASAGFWFYAGFAKHDMFSGLTFIASLYLLLAWVARPAMWRLVALGAVLAVGFGSSWPLIIMLAPVVAFVLFRARSKLELRSFAAATACGLLVLAAIYGSVMVRAAQNPPLNWGAATTPARLLALIDRSDFIPKPVSLSPSGGSSSQPTGRSGQTGKPPSHAGMSASDTGGRPAQTGAPPPAVIPAVAAGATLHLGTSVGAYLQMFWREFGIAGSLLAAWGLLASLAWRRSVASYPILIAFLANLLGAAITVGPGSGATYATDLVEEGFILGCYFALACWVALGADDLVRTVTRSSLLGRFGRLAKPKVIVPAIASVLAALVLIPAVTHNWSVAHGSDNAFADRFAHTVFSELPPRAVIFVWGSDLNFPLEYRQIVYHERPDVAVIAIGGLVYDWYRAQVSHMLGRPLPPEGANPIADTASIMHSLDGVRPVYMDLQASENLAGHVGSRITGLVAQLAPGTQEVAVPLATLQPTVLAAEHSAGLPSPTLNNWPNTYLEQAEYSTAALRVAREYYQQHNFTGMQQALQNVLSIEPQNQTARSDLAALTGTTGG